MRKIELLVPASSLEVLKIAVIFGADAVYIGGEAFGLRAKAKNFSHEDMKEGIAFAHEHGVKDLDKGCKGKDTYYHGNYSKQGIEKECRLVNEQF